MFYIWIFPLLSDNVRHYLQHWSLSILCRHASWKLCFFLFLFTYFSTLYCLLNLFCFMYSCCCSADFVTKQKVFKMYLAREVCTVHSYAVCCGFVSALVPRDKASETVRNRRLLLFIHTVHRTETAVALMPRKNPEMRAKPRYCMVYIYGAP